ncbi:hypothetical protein [Cupriavidus sp. 2SB]|uniref:hypothetical protein n=1 Tax=Cupriavidus sp. 2SB TaxID=2502199 RepID=UPI0010F86B16|nr:hypothetical protein [Cupriavidus sp. 2SB]
MSHTSAVRCLVSAPNAECLSELAARCLAVWASLLNPYSHAYDDLVCRAGGGETVGKLADSYLTILPVDAGGGHSQSLELVATPHAGCHVAPGLLETILSAVLMPHVQALVAFDVDWTTIQGFIPDSYETGGMAALDPQ